jgi:hypothetical protein
VGLLASLVAPGLLDACMRFALGGWGALWIFFVLSVSYVLHHYCIIALFMLCLHMLLVADSNMEPAALLACLNILTCE